MVSENLKRIRLSKGVKQSFLAKQLGITPMTYSRLERGESKLDVDRLQVIAKSLDVPINVFFDDIKDSQYKKEEAV